MQARLRRWAAADSGRRFDDLFNFVHDPAALLVAYDRVAGNRGANTPGVDGMTVRLVEERIGVREFLDGLRARLRSGTFRPLPVRERKIPKPGGPGKLRKPGIPAVAGKVVRAALKLVLEPVFEAGFEPVSYGFRPERRAHDAIAGIHQLGSRGYRWVLDADTGAAFGNCPHQAVTGRVRARIKDKRVPALVKAFLKAGVLTEHLHRPWKPGGVMETSGQRARRRAGGLPNWRVCRYADDFAVLVHGTRDDVETLREQTARVLAPPGLRLPPSRTRIVHMSESLDFPGFRIQWKRKYGSDKWYVYTFIAGRSVRSLKDKIRALTSRTSQQDLRSVLVRLNQIMRGRANYFRHAVCKHTPGNLANFAWWRVIRWLGTLHRWRWKDVRRAFTAPEGRRKPISADGTGLFNMETVPVTRYRYRGSKIPGPWVLDHA